MASVLLFVDVQRNIVEPPDPVPDAVSAAIEGVPGPARARPGPSSATFAAGRS